MLTATDPTTAIGPGSDRRDTAARMGTFLASNRPALVLIAGGIAVATLLTLAQLIAALLLVAIAGAMSNVHARAELRRCAEERAALRRVVTLIARETSPEDVFAAVTEELGQLLGIGGTTMVRYEPDGTVSVVAGWGECRTGSAVGTPIVVDGRRWGAMIAAARQAEPLPAGIGTRIEAFTELVAAAISNLDARSELAVSRARIVAAADAERRRVVRDLHDGAQQRLVHTVVTLKLARQALESDDAVAPALVAEALDHAQHANEELRELSNGVLPAILAHGGLCPGIEALACRMSVPVEVEVAVGRLPARIEATAYFVVAEALTNVAKHARANGAAVSARVENNTLRVAVRDDGVGGARPDGSGLLGLADRLAVLDGRLRVETAAEGGTLVAADIPLRDELAQSDRALGGGSC